MQQQLTAPTCAGIDVQEGGLSVRLSFSFQHPEFSALSAERPTYDATLPEALYRADVAVVEMAAASVPMLLQAFEQAQLVVERSLMDLRLAQIHALKPDSNAPATPTPCEKCGGHGTCRKPYSSEFVACTSCSTSKE